MHIWILYKKEAYTRAKEVEKGIAEGTYTGPLAGVPIAVKDNICIKGKQDYLCFKDTGEFCTAVQCRSDRSSGKSRYDHYR